MIPLAVTIAVTFADLAPFPTWEQAWHNSALAQARLERAEFYAKPQAEKDAAKHAWDCWSALERALRGDRGDLNAVERLIELAKLRRLIGEVDYKAGRMPEPEETK